MIRNNQQKLLQKEKKVMKIGTDLLNSDFKGFAQK